MAQTGVQVLFGFLLAVPFTARFGGLVHTERVLYFATLAAAGAAAMLLIAPGALWSWYLQPMLRRRRLFASAPRA